MDSFDTNVGQRLADALTRFPAAQAELADFAGDAIFPRTSDGQAALSRQVLAALAPHLTDPVVRRLSESLGAYAESTADVDLVAEFGAEQVRHGERALAGLMLEALSPTSRWSGLDGLDVAIRSTAGAFALALVVAALPRQGGTQ